MFERTLKVLPSRTSCQEAYPRAEMTGQGDQEDRLILVREDLVLQGRNPDWKIGWEEGLSAEDRREVQRAVRQGRRVADSRLAPFVFGMAAKWRRSLWLIPGLVLINASIITIQTYFGCLVNRPRGVFATIWCLFFVLLVVASLVVVPAGIWHRRRRLHQAEDANRPLLPS
jgi:hypothetical protein